VIVSFVINLIYEAFLFYCCSFTFSIQAQFQLNGIVKESTANKPLAFATITAADGATTI
jgi:hypothetical protein